MSQSFDPNAAANPDAGIYGLPHSFEDSALIFIPVPWEATTSYGGGTAFGPQAILDASAQLDFFDLDVADPYLCGLHMLPIDQSIATLSSRAKLLSQAIKDAGGALAGDPKLTQQLAEVNQMSGQLNAWVLEQTSKVIKNNKIPAIIGGDHSVPFGAFQSAAQHFGDFGILHFDAHSDTRKEYMGFQHSHASIMRNAAEKIPQVKKIVQVGIRDFCEEEFEFTNSQDNRFHVYYDQKITHSKLSGESFLTLAKKIIGHLPQKVWVSFDIDGLDPRFCPHTGTPVPGGLDYSEAIYIITLLAKSGKTIIGFDLVEIAPPLTENEQPLLPNQASDEWDANVGMRLLYKMSALTLASQGKAKWRAE